jgi:hypothetical protein
VKALERRAFVEDGNNEVDACHKLANTTIRRCLSAKVV